jgi:hypothetical protein
MHWLLSIWQWLRTPPPMEEGESVTCPLLKRNISVGHCLDINLQRIGAFKPDVLTQARQETSLTVEQVSAVCEACPNMPLKSKE